VCTWANYYAIVTIHNHDVLGVFILSLESNASTLAITSAPSNVLSNQTFTVDHLKKASFLLILSKAVAQLLLGTCLFWWGCIGLDLRLKFTKYTAFDENKTGKRGIAKQLEQVKISSCLRLSP
jgi:hypothetical protein